MAKGDSNAPDWPPGRSPVEAVTRFPRGTAPQEVPVSGAESCGPKAPSQERARHGGGDWTSLHRPLWTGAIFAKKILG